MKIKIQRNFKRTLMKGLIVLMFGMCSLLSFGQNAGFFAQGSGGGVIRLTTNGTAVNTYNWSNNLGDLYSLTLNGGIIHTFKNGSGNICGGSMFWRVYKVGNTPGSYNSLSLPFSANHTFSTTASPSTVNSGGSGDQRWQDISLTTNLFNDANISGEVGSCRIDVYFTATGCLSNSSCCTDNFSVGSSGSPLQLSFTKARLSNVASGNWNTAGTWSPSGIPASGESIAILTGNNITLDVAANISNLIINTGGTFTSNDGTNRTLTINTGTSTSATSLTNNGTWTNGGATTTVAFSGSPASSAVISTSGNISFQNVSITSTTSNAYGLAFPGASTSVNGTLTIGKAGYIASITNSSFWGSSSILTFDQGTGETFVLDAGGVTWKTGSEPRPKSVVVNSGTLDIGNSRTLSSAVSTTSLTVNPGAVLTVASSQTLTQSTGGTITLKSDASGTGSIGNSAGSILGNVTVERYIPALGVRGRYRFIASPVAGRTIADWMNNFYITGPGTGTTLGDPNSNGWHTSNANIINATVTSTSVLTYNEATISSDLNTGWTNLSATSQAITPGLGFRAFLRGTNNGTPTNVTYTPQIGANANSQTQATFTISLSGAITNNVNAGTITLPATFTSSGTLANDGWNLVGNPYPSTIDWNAASGWTKTNIGGTIWIFNPSTNSYGNWDGATPTNSVTRYISSGQAFFVKASATPTFSCTEAVKVSTAGASIFKSTEINTLRIGLIKDESNKDETVIRFMEGKNNEFSEADDVRKFYNPTVNVSSYFGADKYSSVNYLKNELIEDKIIPISVWVDEVGNYKLNFTGMKDFTLSKNIFLKDKFLNTITDIEINPSVDFVFTSDSNSKGDNRFEVVFVAKTSTTTKEDLLTLSNTNLTIYPNPATDFLNISLSNSNFKNSTIIIYNVSGMEVSKSTMNGSTAQLNIESLSNGVYFVKVSNENGFSKTVKFVK